MTSTLSRTILVCLLALSLSQIYSQQVVSPGGPVRRALEANFGGAGGHPAVNQVKCVNGMNMSAANMTAQMQVVFAYEQNLTGYASAGQLIGNIDNSGKAKPQATAKNGLGWNATVSSNGVVPGFLDNGSTITAKSTSGSTG